MSASDIVGTVVDKDKEPLMQATVRLLKSDSTFVKGTTADIDGKFKLQGVKAGKYIIEASYVGYDAYAKDIAVSSDKTLRLEPFEMKESTVMLKEVNVVGVKTPVKVMTDTVEFNADSYKTRPNAVVEDLLKRLPGVEVDADGKITANGKEITKILVDGKEFFSDDPKVASKNLPVELVDKLQVIDRKSDLARLTGVDDGEDETIINLSVKKGMKNGWFGTAEAGYGTNNRYQVNFNVSRFHNDNQFTLLGNFNNVNELGFTDGNGNRFRRFGGDNGITSSQAVGFNFNVGNGEIFRVGGNVMYSHSDKDARQRSERQYLFPDSTSYNSSYKETRDKGHNVRADFRVMWQPDSFNTLEFRPNISLNFNKSLSADTAMTRAGDAQQTPVNHTINNAASDGKSFELGARLIYTHNFKSHRGRSFSIMANYRMSNVKEKENTSSWNRFFLLDDYIDEYEQYLDNHKWNNSISARVSWTEPLGNVTNGNFLTLSYHMTYRWNNTDKMVYDRIYDYDESGMRLDTYQDVLNPDLSNRFRNNFFTQNIRVGYKKVTSKMNAEVGVSFVPSTSQSINLDNSEKSIPLRKVFNVSPFLRFNYKFSKSTSLTARYNGRSSEPSMTQLQPVADVSNPLNIIQGNPNLAPTFTHNVNVRFQDFSADAQRSMMGMLFVNVTQNSIASKTIYDSTTGGQVTTYENVNGVWNGMAMFMFSQPLSNKKWSVNAHTFLRLNRNVGFTNGDRSVTLSTNWRIEPAIAFRPDNVELEVRPYYSLQNTSQTISTNVPSLVHNYGFRFNGTAYTNWGLTFTTDLNYQATKGYADGYNTNMWLWNAELAYQFLKDRSCTVSVKVYDILNQKNNIRRNTTASYIEDVDYNSLTRYVMFKFAYKFNTFGKGNQPEDRNMMRGPHGGMMGPPPRH
ncbi:MAG: TonB-dependent receptor [Muribaculaceae bacterium]|nr:TonB-dependent receptor [Muribaculaceae bacterium]